MDALRVVAELMSVSARTAPKTKGEDHILTKIIEGEDMKRLAHEMIEYGDKHKRTNFDRDAKGILASSTVLLIGLKDAKPAMINCGACGFKNCNEASKQINDGEFKGLICAFRLLDLGIALGSAVKTAMCHNVDNRIIYRIGAVARSCGIVDWDMAIGIPLSASGKNPHFDR
jgi:uncharacterized ferredoxin-like protein